MKWTKVSASWNNAAAQYEYFSNPQNGMIKFAGNTRPDFDKKVSDSLGYYKGIFGIIGNNSNW